MLTRKHFKEIADIIKKHSLINGDPAKLYREIAHDLATMCKKDNPSFNRSKFIKACGWYDE